MRRSDRNGVRKTGSQRMTMMRHLMMMKVWERPRLMSFESSLLVNEKRKIVVFDLIEIDLFACFH